MWKVKKIKIIPADIGSMDLKSEIEALRLISAMNLTDQSVNSITFF